MTLHWHAWRELDPDLLYSILRLRSQVFVVEQNCVFLDMDGLDPQCLHLCATQDGTLVGVLRLLPPGVKRAEPVLGRVVVAPDARRGGLGARLMREGVDRCESLYPGQPIWISAQEHLQPFYGRLGFAQRGERYLDDGIWHVDMRRPGG